jgi:hypothetical protein
MLEDKIIEIFHEWGKVLVDDTKAAIDSAIASDGGGQASKLSGSVNYKVLNQGGVITFQLTMNDYWEYQDRGVDGTEKSHGSKFKFKKKNLNQKAMLNFINTRHLKIELDVKTKGLNKKLKNKTVRRAHKQISIDKKKKTLAFILGRSIAKKGIKPLHFMDKVITDERINKLKAMLKPVIKNEFLLELKS